jgi:hypothetical protein
MTDGTGNARLRSLQGGFDFISKHFAVLSVAAAVIGAAMAMIFIAAYLRVFDWRIIWIVEYSDVLKIGLIVVALLSGFSFFIWSSASQAIDFAKQSGRTRIVSVSFGVAILCLSLGIYLYEDYRSPEPHYALHIWVHLAVLAIIGLVTILLSAVRNFQQFDASRAALVVLLVVTNVSIVGTAFGYYTRDTQGFNHDVFLKNEELRSVGVVMLTSHHVVLYTKDHTVIVVPASDVAKLERHKPK